jgi:sugar lactone lactonase YvrE
VSQPIETRVLHTPAEEAWRFLPEGPYRCADGRISWVAIQHGRSATTGSLHLLTRSATATQDQSFPLPGRPGFAFPTTDPQRFVVGLERAVVLFNTQDGTLETLCDGIDSSVEQTIINDGVVFDGHLVFGCKDLKFAEKKAGLYLLRRGERRAVLLDQNQICSNGKAVVPEGDGRYTLYDIDSPSKQVLAWKLDVPAGRLSSPRVVVDMTAGPVFPDGMILSPDGRSVIIAFYDPRDVEQGEARQYSLATGELEQVWTCPQSPRVTCPQLVVHDGRIELLLTTADEGMAPELRARCPNAGCLFIGPTSFTTLNDGPAFPL